MYQSYWRNISKLVTADEAIKQVNPVIGWIWLWDYVLDFDEAGQTQDELEDVKIRCDIGAPALYGWGGLTINIYWNSWHVAGRRKFINKITYSYEVSRKPMMTEKTVFLLYCGYSCMDKHGYFNFGEFGQLLCNDGSPGYHSGSKWRCHDAWVVSECLHVRRLTILSKVNEPIATIGSSDLAVEVLWPHIIERLYDSNCIQLNRWYPMQSAAWWLLI